MEKGICQVICQYTHRICCSEPFYQGWIKDIGEGGMFIDANGPFSIGQDISMIYLSPRGLREKRTGKISRVISQGIGVKISLPGYSR